MPNALIGSLTADRGRTAVGYLRSAFGACIGRPTAAGHSRGTSTVTVPAGAKPLFGDAIGIATVQTVVRDDANTA